MSNYHIDYETFSSTDLRSLGHYRYANGDDTEILMFAIAVGDQEPHLWLNPKYCPDDHDNDPALALLWEALEDEEALIYAHNAPFEAAISKYRMYEDIGLDCPPIEKWRCTAAMARKAALPASLEKCAQALGLSQQKDKTGSDLIKLFSIPDRKGNRTLPTDDPTAFKQFGEYCLQDVRTEQEIHKALHAFDLKDLDLDGFLLYQRINDRGLPVDVDTLQIAAEIVQEAEAKMAEEFMNIVQFKHTQRAKILGWLGEQGFPYENLQAATVKKALDKCDKWCSDPDVYMALHLKQQLGFAAFKKIQTMLNCACDDKRVRGSLLYYGAHTGRGSGRLMQPQNFKRPTIKGTEEIYARLKAGELTREMMEEEYGNPLEVVSSCIRHFIHAEDDGLFLDADYAAVEARIVCWLGGQEDALQDYRDGVDGYIRLAVSIFNCDEADQLRRKEAGESTVERFVGKQARLGCGFQMGIPRFLDTCNGYGFTIPQDEVEKYMSATGITNYKEAEDLIKWDLAETAVHTYRKQNPGVVDLWKSTEEAAKQAIRNPGKVFYAGELIKFQVTHTAGMKFLVMQLPSGRNIVYPHPELRPREQGRGDAVYYWTKLPGREIYGHVGTYGGKLVENATQGVAADVMACGSCVAEQHGYQIATLIHDEALAFKTNDLNIDDFCEHLSTLPAWADGLPIEAEGYETPYYKK